MADDIWDDKWNLEEHPIFSRINTKVEFKDGQFIVKEQVTTDGDLILQVGDVIKPEHLTGSLYFMLLFAAMKRAGVEKPSNIILNVKNAKDIFDRNKNKYLPTESSQPATN
jgi:hypothetical protein